MTGRRVPVASLAIVAAVLACAACAAPVLETRSGPVPPSPTIEDAWIQLPAAGDMAFAYMSIQGAAVDTPLVRVTSPSASRATLQQWLGDPSAGKGLRAVPQIPIPANATVVLAPGGYAIRLEGLHQPLAVGQHIQLEVSFETTGTEVSETFEAAVRGG